MDTPRITRRSFLKATAVAGAAAAAGVSMTGSLEEGAAASADDATETETVVTSCHGCIQMCPAVATIENGVVTKLEGDERAPVSRGSLCLKGLNQIHTMYSPRRILHPIKRAGERGQNKWEVISWDEAVELAAQRIKDGIDKFGNYSFFASVGGGGSYSFVEAMTIPHAFGSPTVFEPGCAQCYLPRWTLGQLLWGGTCQSIADNDVQEIFKDVDNAAEVVVLWGAQPSVSQTAESGRGMAELRAAGVKTIVVDPNFSPDAAKADVWLPLRPQTDCGVVLSWFRYIFENELYNENFTKYWTNMPFLVHQDPSHERYKLPVYASEIWPDYESPTPEDTPVYACFDLRTNTVQPFVYSLPEDSDVDPEIFWEGDYEGVHYKTAGQICRDEAEPWTLEYTEEITFVPADLNEAAIRLYTHADDDGSHGGICNGVASDMNEFASQLPIGLMGLDSIMGYINQPGSTLTTYGQDLPTTRPVTYCNGFSGMFSDMYGIGAVIGLSDAQNAERIQQLGEAMPDSQRIHNQLLVDRLGMRDYKGLYAWCHSHIPSVREAIATGEPYRPRVWFDMSGNKLAMLGNAKSWYEVFPEIDFVIGQYPHLTSFQIEACDLVFPLREWLEEPMVNMNQLGTLWLQNECTHIGETVSHGIPGGRVVDRVREMYGGHVPNALELGGGSPYMGDSTEEAVKAGVAESLYAPDWETLVNNTDEYVPYLPENYWRYNQHETIVDDGLPAGFGTESRKIECYFQILVRLARTGYPYCYPNPQQACEDYSPICNYIEPCESPYSEAEQQLADRDDYPLIITSGRVPYFHHGTMRHAPFARELFPAPDVKMNPQTAADLGIEHMDWVKVTSRRGSTHGRAYLSEGIHPQYVWMERFWNPECFDDTVPEDQQTAGWRECNINVLTKNTAPFNEVFGSYTNRGFTVRVEKSEKPDLVWEQPEEFEPFMPTLQGEARTEDVF